MRPREFTDDMIDRAEAMRAAGEKWSVIELCMCEGMKQACYRRRVERGIPSFTEVEETLFAMRAWDGVGDRDSFIAGYIKRARRNQGRSWEPMPTESGASECTPAK